MPARRFISVVGPGGIGKTTVALAAAELLVTQHGYDARFVDFAALNDPALVPSAIASAFDLPTLSESPMPALIDSLSDRQFLLVLDSCDHVIQRATIVAEQIVRQCPGAWLLATSREPLRAAGERVIRIGPLIYPTDAPPRTAAEALTYPAIQLFADRASANDDTFRLSDADAPIAAEICRRLDGIALAIELAAGRIDLFGVGGLAARLDDRFNLLAGGRRTALPRQQTLRATFDWSYDFLPESERALLRALTVFVGPFPWEAAAAVTAARPDGERFAQDLANLFSKSLVSVDASGVQVLYRLLDTTRAYAAEKIVGEDEARSLARRHAEYFLGLFERSAGESVTNAVKLADLSTAEDKLGSRREIDNIRAAIDWSLSTTGELSIGLELTASSAPLWFQLSLMVEYRERVERAVERLKGLSEPDDVLEMRLQTALGHAIWYTKAAADAEALERAFGRALMLAERTGNTDIQLQALWGTWAAGRGSGNHVAAMRAATRYQMLANEVGDHSSTIFAERLLALTHHDLGQQKLARRHAENVLRQARDLDLQHVNTYLQVDARIAMLALLPRILWLQGFPDQAMAAAQDAIDTALKTGHWFSVCYVLFMAGCPISLWVGDNAEARRRIDLLRDGAGAMQHFSRYVQSFDAILRLRHGSRTDALTASYMEPRLQYSTMPALDKLTSATTISVPLPDDIPCDAPWSLPEVLRADAEILLWRGGADAESAAEAKLERSLALAREQSALSWELRAALSLARLKLEQDQPDDVRQVLEPVYSKFTEGFETFDLRSAHSILQSVEADD
jgi:predicted ATPase